jgi:hypothetical protein
MQSRVEAENTASEVVRSTRAAEPNTFGKRWCESSLNRPSKANSRPVCVQLQSSPMSRAWNLAVGPVVDVFVMHQKARLIYPSHMSVNPIMANLSMWGGRRAAYIHSDDSNNPKTASVPRSLMYTYTTKMFLDYLLISARIIDPIRCVWDPVLVRLLLIATYAPRYHFPKFERQMGR